MLLIHLFILTGFWPDLGDAAYLQISTLDYGLTINLLTSAWVYHCFIVVTQISNRAPVAAWTLKDADALAVPQQAFVKIVYSASVLRK